LRVEVSDQGVDVGVGYLSWIDTDMVRGADAIDGLRELRAGFPYPFNRTYPASVAVEALARAVARRPAHAYAPWWLRALPLGRGAIPATTYYLSRRNAGRAQTLMRRRGTATQALVGAGGAADERARTPAPDEDRRGREG